MSDFKTVSVIGLGYIGLPTSAVLASSGLKVIGVDIDLAVVDTINAGRIHIVEPDLAGLIARVVATGALRATNRPEPADAFIIAVPTPLRDDLKPDLRYVIAAAHSIAPVLKTGDLIVLESTSPVGTTRQISALLAQLRPDLSFPEMAGEAADIHIAYSPERVLPGRVLHELISNDRSVGGLSDRASQRAAALYQRFVKGEITITTAETAELVKLSENAFRDVNIAFANELAEVCQALGLNVWEVIELANRHPRVTILQPGPGVGGHCIAVDPYFIIDAVPERTPLLRAARSVNAARPHGVVAEIMALKTDTRRQTIACLGLSFKPNIDDLRESPAVEVVNLLADTDAFDLLLVEPHITALPADLARRGLALTDALNAIERADIVLLLVDHRQFGLIDLTALEGKALVDTRGFWTWKRAPKSAATLKAPGQREVAA